jgi:hypothetical protein
MIANLHPADELHELRAQKGEIDRRIREVRALILELPSAERFGSNRILACWRFQPLLDAPIWQEVCSARAKSVIFTEAGRNLPVGADAGLRACGQGSFPRSRGATVQLGSLPRAAVLAAEGVKAMTC